ncbi:hypothetical protein ACF3MZ_04320 [Paenibacillaceae bacterium WGS1546]|uniref:hypothetical protein n=1 Tax=Cohnella sp. WGS1546 TaxID=3366810 RepID=UPI00372D2C3A
MIKYYMTEINSHLDDGFGVTADSFYKSAEAIKSSEEYDSVFNPQKQLPVLYLFRHSCELFTKSLILIVHRKLSINFGLNKDQLPNCKTPTIYNNKKNEWVELYKCHDVRVLLDYLMKLVDENKSLLDEMAPEAHWGFDHLNYNDLLVLDKYDFDSTFLRYPVTRDRGKDRKKETFKRFTSLKKIKRRQGNTGNIILITKDKNGNFVEGFQMVDNVLSDLEQSIKEIAKFLNGYHIMTRMTLCEGW